MDDAIKHTVAKFGCLPNVARHLHISTSTAKERARYLGVDFNVSKPWTKEHLDILKDSWQKNLTGSEIGNLIGKSRCAVLGKASRLNLSGRITGVHPRSIKGKLLPKDRPPRVRTRKAATPPKTDMKLTIPKKATPPKFYPAAVPLTTKPPIAIGELRFNTCRAIVGRGADGLAVYCGDMTFPEKPFCEGHCAIYYQYRDSRRRA